MLQALLPLAANVGMSLLSRDKKKQATFQPRALPDYDSFKSKTDEQDAGESRDFYRRRMQGTDTGLGADDLNMLNANAIDDSAYQSKEMMDRAGARNKTMTGGMEMGPRARDERAALGQSLMARSKAMRDVGIQNAVMKWQDKWSGAKGFDHFREGERTQQGRRYNAAMDSAKEDRKVEGMNYDVGTANARNAQLDKQNFRKNLFGTALSFAGSHGWGK